MTKSVIFILSMYRIIVQDYCTGIIYLLPYYILSYLHFVFIVYYVSFAFHILLHLVRNYSKIYSGGKGAKHNLISPKDATSYLTIKGKSFPKHISKLEHNGVHLMKLLNDFKENSP